MSAQHHSFEELGEIAARLVARSGGARKDRVSIVRNDKGRIVGTRPRPRPCHTCDCGEHCFVFLSGPHVTLFSPDDLDIFSSVSVYAMGSPPLHYAYFKGAEGKNVAAHRYVMNAQAGLEIDHLNHNGLDNRRENLRVVTRGENTRNRRRPASSTGYFGVNLHAASGLYRAYVHHNGRQLSAGYFHTPAEAAHARDNLIQALGLSTASLNFSGGG